MKVAEIERFQDTNIEHTKILQNNKTKNRQDI